MHALTVVLFAVMGVSAILLVASLVRSVLYLRRLQKLNSLSDEDFRRELFRPGNQQVFSICLSGRGFQVLAGVHSEPKDAGDIRD
jgi:hypothetical protein